MNDWSDILGPALSDTPVADPSLAADDLYLGEAPTFAPQQIEKGSEIETFPSTAQVIGETINDNDFVLNELDWRQKKNIALLARHCYVTDQFISGEAIWKLWPVGLNRHNSVSPSITDPEERGKIFRAGIRPEISQIQRYIKTDNFAYTMSEFGIEVDPNDLGLTAEQTGFLTILSNIADGKDLKKKLRDAGIPWAKYQVWLSQPDFSAAYEAMMKKTLKQVVPFAAQQLASKMAAGDMAATKLGFEITGFHDPANKKQVDAGMLMQIILDVIEEEVKDKDTLLAIATKFQLRGAKALGSGTSE